MSRTTSFLIVSCLLFVSVLKATIFDNRYIPFLQRPYIVVPGQPSHASFDVFFATASKAFGPGQIEEIGIPELTGRYNQNSVARSFVALGCPNPLPSEFQNKNIFWVGEGKLQAQGFEFSLRKQFRPEWFAGFYWYFMRVDTTSDFLLNANTDGMQVFNPSQRLELDRVRRGMNALAGLTTGDHASQVGFGDIDAYLMWQRHWDYIYKFRSIWAQASVGALVPAGQSRQLDEPTSIPFGGNGFWGAYIQGQGEFELKEDWKAGVFMRVSKRFARTKLERVPLFCEPQQFSPFISEVDINPGPTFVAMGWANFEGLHKGLGMRVLLTVRKHFKDSWDIQCCPPMCETNICDAEKFTEWGSDYITLNVYYDFGKTKVNRSFEPIIYFAWDVPSNMLTTEQTLKTNKIILGVEFSF